VPGRAWLLLGASIALTGLHLYTVLMNRYSSGLKIAFGHLEHTNEEVEESKRLFPNFIMRENKPETISWQA
jgi:hypothetical protein